MKYRDLLSVFTKYSSNNASSKYKYGAIFSTTHKNMMHLLGGPDGKISVWLKVMAYEPSAASSVRHDRELNIFPFGFALS